jgi:hypothetical protein
MRGRKMAHMTSDIPALRPFDQTPPIRSVSDLDRWWRSVKGPWGFSRPQIWCAVLGPGGELTPILIKVEDCPDRPDPDMIGYLFERLAAMVEDQVPGGSVAVMFARPGGDDHREDDRRWARHLDACGRRAPFDVWPVFLANDIVARMASPDDLAA